MSNLSFIFRTSADPDQSLFGRTPNSPPCPRFLWGAKAEDDPQVHDGTGKLADQLTHKFPLVAKYWEVGPSPPHFD